jgi:ankyrin repeat protein
MGDHPIFIDILHGDPEEVQRRVLADPVVLEERTFEGSTPLVYAIFWGKPAIALWLIQHRGQHNLETHSEDGGTALHYACAYGPLSVVQALVGAGANPAALDDDGETPLMWTADNDHPDIVAFLLQLPAAKAAINAISSDDYPSTALSLASLRGRLCIVQLLLDHGADPTIPAGPYSPLNRAINSGHTDIAALLRRAINDADIARFLHKARSLLTAAATIAKARKDAHDKGLSPAEQQHKALAAAPEWVKGRVAEEGRALPRAELTPPPPQQQQQQQQQQQRDEQEQEQQQEEEEEEKHKRLRATAGFVLGLEGGEEEQGLPDELFVELLGYMLVPWADKGPEA